MTTLEEYLADAKRDAALFAALNTGDADFCAGCHQPFFESDLFRDLNDRPWCDDCWNEIVAQQDDTGTGPTK